MGGAEEYGYGWSVRLNLTTVLSCLFLAPFHSSPFSSLPFSLSVD